MKIAEVFIEHPVMHLDHTFTYHCDHLKVQRGVRVLVPFGKREIMGFVHHVKECNDDTVFSYQLKNITQVIDDEPLINEELFTLADWMAKSYIAPAISCFQCMLPAKLKPSSTHGRIKKEVWVKYHHEHGTLTPKQQIALQAIKENDMLRTLFYQRYKSPGKKLIELGNVTIYEKEASVTFTRDEQLEQPYRLSDEQLKAMDALAIDKGHEIILLHGATGSGKTEIFLQKAAQVMEAGKQVLILVPEISLTPQMVQRVKRRFGSHVAIYHSDLNAQQKYEQYQLVKQHLVQIVVGTRSAVFMPFDDLGIIIMDEEHETSYKQDRTPRYHCRDVAIQRANYHNAKLLLASATPSLESYARAHKGVYRLIEMPNRINQNFPHIHIVEMRKAIENKESYVIGNDLLDAMYERFQRKEQMILLLNRRGYTPVLRCIACGFVQMCPHCEVAMSYHKGEQVLKCHTCGHTMPVPAYCPDCGSPNWRYMGMGTQKLEEFVQIKFPQAKILRMDADTTNHKSAHEQMLQQFANHEADILLGTQMIAKGLDFENVTLVGIINGDAMLNRSDYRSAELTYDLLAQAMGRSGRGDKAGEVYIQVYDPNHYAIQCAANHDYVNFFKHEMNYRHLANYPPYTYIASMIFSDKKEEQMQMSIRTAMDILDKKDGCKILGPAPLTKVKDEHRMRILLKGKDEHRLNTYVYEIYRNHIQTKQKARLDIDMSPVTLDE